MHGADISRRLCQQNWVPLCLAANKTIWFVIPMWWFFTFKQLFGSLILYNSVIGPNLHLSSQFTKFTLFCGNVSKPFPRIMAWLCQRFLCSLTKSPKRDTQHAPCRQSRRNFFEGDFVGRNLFPCDVSNNFSLSVPTLNWINPAGLSNSFKFTSDTRSLLTDCELEMCFDYSFRRAERNKKAFQDFSFAIFV